MLEVSARAEILEISKTHFNGLKKVLGCLPQRFFLFPPLLKLKLEILREAKFLIRGKIMATSLKAGKIADSLVGALLKE